MKMIRRIVSFLLMLVLLGSMLPQITPQAEAATQISDLPYPMVEYGYSDSVSCGTIRYMSQSTSSSYFSWNYWPTSPFGKYTSPGSECGTASISMALSYVGINKTPIDILGDHGITYFGVNWGGAEYIPYSYGDLKRAFDNYVNGNGKYSPPIIHLVNYASPAYSHYVVLIACSSENVYTVLDPASTKLWSITINGASAIYTHPNTGGYISDSIASSNIHQWYNPNAVPPCEHTTNNDIVPLE